MGPNKTIFIPLTAEYFPDVFNGDGKPITRLRIDPFDQDQGGPSWVDEVYFDLIEFGKDVTPPQLTINTPRLGERITGNIPYNISWTSTDSIGVDYVKIELECGTSSQPVTLRTANSGYFSWTPPDETNNCRIKVTASDNAGNKTESTSGAFDIIKSSTPEPTGNFQISDIRDSNSQPMANAGVKVTYLDMGRYWLINTNPSGLYSLTGLAAGNYEVYTYISGYTFPSNTIGNIQLSTSTPSSTANFTATLIAYSFKGYVKLADGTGVEGVTVTVSGNRISRSTTTDQQGFYTFTLPPETYRISLTSLTHFFDPVERSVQVGNAYFGIRDQNFIASAKDGYFVSSATNAGIRSLQATRAACWGDFDNDGYEDLYVPSDLAGAERGNRLYRNKGDGTFEDINIAAGAADTERSIGCVWFDYDGDGFLDLYAVNWDKPSKLYRNNGNNTFDDVAPSLGLDLPNEEKFCAAVADYDNDGELDLFVGDYSGKHLLFKNNGGAFQEVAQTAGLGQWNDINATSCSWADYDRDGHIDLYVGRPESGLLYRNNGDGTFRQTSEGSYVNNIYGVAWGDFNNDGFPDIFVNSSSQGTCQGRLFKNNGDGSFTDVALDAGIEPSTGAAGGATWFDYDNDGWLDLYVGTYGGKLYHNNGDGSFTDVTSTAGAGTSEVPRAVVTADYDNDGIADLFIGQLKQNLLLKGKDFGNHYIKIRLQDIDSANRYGVGAVIRVYANGFYQYRTVTAGTGLSSMDSMTINFGLGTAASSDIRVFWPDGTEDEFYDVGRDYTMTIIRGSGQDDEPPAAINDLKVEKTTTDSITVGWTAPGDDGRMRTASRYEIRYALFDITEFIGRPSYLLGACHRYSRQYR